MTRVRPLWTRCVVQVVLRCMGNLQAFDRRRKRLRVWIRGSSLVVSFSRLRKDVDRGAYGSTGKSAEWKNCVGARGRRPQRVAQHLEKCWSEQSLPYGKSGSDRIVLPNVADRPATRCTSEV